MADDTREITRASIKTMFPHVGEASVAYGVELYESAKPLRDAIGSHPNEQARQFIGQQLAALLVSAVQMLPASAEAA